MARSKKGSWEKSLIPNESRGFSSDLFAIAALAGVGIVGFYFLRGSDAFKSLINAGNSTGDWIADGSYWLQKQLGIGNTPGGRGEEKNIIEKLAEPFTKDVASTKSDIKSKKEDYVRTWKPLADAVDSSVDAIRGIGCHGPFKFRNC